MTTQAASHYLFPAWRFNGGGKALPIVQKLLADARRAGLDEKTLTSVAGERRRAVRR